MFLPWVMPICQGQIEMCVGENANTACTTAGVGTRVRRSGSPACAVTTVKAARPRRTADQAVLGAALGAVDVVCSTGAAAAAFGV